MTVNIINLSTELLLLIFQYCDIYDICRLRRCCRRFNNVLTQNDVILNMCVPLVTNQLKQTLLNRSKIFLKPFEKWRISHNWKVGRYKLYTYNKKIRCNMPCLYLEGDQVWISEENILKSYKRLKNSGNKLIDKSNPNAIIENPRRYSVLTKFSIENNIILCGNRDGGILWTTRDSPIIEQINHESDVTCVDIGKSVFVSGSHDCSFSIGRYNYDNFEELPNVLARNNICERIWSVKISPNNKYVAVGSSGVQVFPLHIYDLESLEPAMCTTGRPFRKGSGILDIHWEDDNTILTCGYDSFLRKWDVRSGKCVRLWEEPHDSTLYCLTSDDLYSVFCGTDRYGKVVLWDQRKINYVQMYYTCDTSESSPVYSLSFDGTELFAALDRSLRILNFSKRKCQKKSYSELFSSTMIKNY